MKKKTRFELEEDIMDCWNIVNDIETIYHAEELYSNEDEMMNALIGLRTLYQLKFDKLFKTFESCCELGVEKNDSTK